VLDVRKSPELQAAVLALKTAERQIVRDINKDARAQLAPVWQQQLVQKARSPLEQAVMAKGPKVSISDRRVRVQAATSRRALSGGLVPAEQYAGVEWGARPQVKEIAGKSPRGRAYRYKRTVNRQFRARTKQGHVAMRAAGDVGPAIVSAWLRIVVGHFAAAYEVKR
jgi:hypothetical protein